MNIGESCVVDVVVCDLSLNSYISETVSDDSSFSRTISLLHKYSPKEVVCTVDQEQLFKKLKGSLSDAKFSVFSGDGSVSSASGLLDAYLSSLQLQVSSSSLASLDEFSCSSRVSLDGRLLEALEVMSPERNRKTLLKAIDFTVTAGGFRKLFGWISTPLTSKHDILQRQACVAGLVGDCRYLDTVRSSLRGIPDLERLLNSFSSTSNFEGLATKLVGGLIKAKVH